MTRTAPGSSATSPAGKAAPPAVRALLLDFGGTLDADGIPWKERFFRLYRAEGLAPAGEAFDRAFYRADDALVGVIPETLSFEETVQRLAAGVSEGLGVPDRAVSARVARRFVDDALDVLGRNRPILARLGRRYRLGVVSNFYGNLAAVCRDAGIAALFGVLVDSTQAGVSKPDPRIFELALDGLGVSATEAVFVGDSPGRDMHGARRTGMRHVWLGGEAATMAAPCCPGDPVVRSLVEIEGLLP